MKLPGQCNSALQLLNDITKPSGISFLSPICVSPFVGGEGGGLSLQRTWANSGTHTWWEQWLPWPGLQVFIPPWLFVTCPGRPACRDTTERLRPSSDPHRALLPALWVWGEGFHLCVLLCHTEPVESEGHPVHQRFPVERLGEHGALSSGRGRTQVWVGGLLARRQGPCGPPRP